MRASPGGKTGLRSERRMRRRVVCRSRASLLCVPSAKTYPTDFSPSMLPGWRPFILWQTGRCLHDRLKVTARKSAKALIQEYIAETVLVASLSSIAPQYCMKVSVN